MPPPPPPPPPRYSPPSNWRQLFRAVQKYRATTLTNTTVDTMGCWSLYDARPHVPPGVVRYHRLLALMLSSQTRDEVTADVMAHLLYRSPEARAIDDRRFPGVAAARYGGFGGANANANATAVAPHVARESAELAAKMGAPDPRDMRFVTPESVCGMSAAALDAVIRRVSFHNNKTRFLQQAAELIVTRHGSEVPRTYAELVALPGVGPKMAHLFFQEADGIGDWGIGVDTHVHRIAQRFGWAPSQTYFENNDNRHECDCYFPARRGDDDDGEEGKVVGRKRGRSPSPASRHHKETPVFKRNYTPEDTRKCLESWLPKRHWAEINLMLVGLGQSVCRPRFPLCHDCHLNKLCPNAFRESNKKAKTASSSRDASPSASDSASDSGSGAGAVKARSKHRAASGGGGSGATRKKGKPSINDVAGNRSLAAAAAAASNKKRAKKRTTRSGSRSASRSSSRSASRSRSPPSRRPASPNPIRNKKPVGASAAAASGVVDMEDILSELAFKRTGKTENQGTEGVGKPARSASKGKRK